MSPPGRPVFQEVRRCKVTLGGCSGDRSPGGSGPIEGGLAAVGRLVWLGSALASGLLLGVLPESGFGEAGERDAGGNPTVQRFQLLNGLRILLLHRQGDDRLVVKSPGQVGVDP